MSEAKWYVVHTYSGYENKVKANIEKTIENRHLEDQILEVRVPLQDVVEMKNGAAKQVQKKMFPGYVLLNMVMNDDTWYVVRNTRGVTGFVGPGSKPVPLTEEEMKPLGIKNDNVEIDFGVGDVIVPKQERRKIPTQLGDFTAPTVNTYSIETTVAEKIDAILSLMEFSSRMKDYYDIYYLANKFDFDGNVLTEALSRTFQNREHNFTVVQFEQVMSFDEDMAMQKKWKAFVRKIDTKTDDYSTVLKTIKVFLIKPFIAAVMDKEFTEKWYAANGKWM